MNLQSMAERAWPRTEYTSPQTTESLRQKWIAAIERLGTKWLLHPANYKRRKS